MERQYRHKFPETLQIDLWQATQNKDFWSEIVDSREGNWSNVDFTVRNIASTLIFLAATLLEYVFQF